MSINDITDDDIDDIITLSDKKVDSIPNVTMTSDQQELVSTYLASAMVMDALASEDSVKPAKFTLDRFKVDRKSSLNHKTALATKFLNEAERIAGQAINGTGILKIGL